VLLLEYARRKQRWSQTQVSVLTDILQQHISDLERGKIWPTPAQRERLARLLDVPSEHLLDEVEVAESVVS
jgi:transcriptional regulator with XRE-family HTH domain